MMNKTVYKIRNNKTGLFSKGGTYPSWTKKGKIWTQKGGLSNHLNLVTSHWNTRNNSIYNSLDVEVVEYELIENEVGIVNIHDWINELIVRHHERERQARQRVENYNKEKRRQEFENLKKEFGT